SQQTKKAGKREWYLDKHGILDVQQAVFDTKATYDAKPRFTKARLWLQKLSTRLMHYSSVMDILAQHHPEYVSLAWGAMKFVLMGIINHEELVKNLAKGLCQIADALPRIELKSIRYPTEHMKDAVAFLYAQILKFLQRAAHWYAEGKLKHMVSAIVRLYQIRFKDLVEDIADCARKVDQLAVASNMAELRGMHLEQANGWAQIAELKKMIDDNHRMSLNIQLDTNGRVCEVQLSQILQYTADISLPSPQ
ncbi:hypothetical protein LSUE1_G009196, partial [Lachnellula suecica]